MSDLHDQFVGSIPEKYEEHLGPLFFEYYAADLARRVAESAQGAVLELACGTGILTGALREALPDSVEIVATDLNEPMVEFARRKRGHLPNVKFEKSDAMALPYGDHSFDTVVSQFGVMFFPDKTVWLREMDRLIRPGGLLAFNIWDSLRWNPIARLAHEVIGGFFDHDPPTFLLTPFGYYELEPIKALLLEAGFGRMELSVVPTWVERPSAHHVATGFVQGNPTAVEIRDRVEVSQEVIIKAVAEAMRQEFGDGPMRVPLQAIVVCARRADD